MMLNIPIPLFLISLLLVIIGLIYIQDIEDQPIHTDEHAWVQRGALYFESYFIDWNFSASIWQARNAFDQPKLGEMVFGAWTRWWFHQDLDKLFSETDFNQGWDESKPYRGWWTNDKWWIGYSGQYPQQSFIPEKWQPAYNILIVNRYLTIVFSLLTLSIIFLIGKELHNVLSGLIATILLAQTPLYYQLSRLALTDIHLELFILAGLFAFLKLIKNRNSLRWLAFSTLSLGAAVSTKLNGSIAGILSVIWFLGGYFKSMNHRNIVDIFIYLRMTSCLLLGTILIFILLNPFTWPNPLLHTYRMFAWRNFEAHNFQTYKQNTAYYSVLDRWSALFNQTVLPAGSYRIFARLPNSWLDFSLLVLGLLTIILSLIKTRSKAIGPFFYWFLGVFVAMGAYLTVGTDRYFIPIIPYLALIQAFGLSKAIGFGMKQIESINKT